MPTASEVFREVAALIRPPRRTRPSELAAKYLRNERGPWSAELAPMMVEPLDAIASRECSGVVFVGPARSSKTFSLMHGAMVYAALSNADATVVSMSQDAARDFSRTEVDRVIANSPELAARLSARDDFTHDKQWRSGATLKIVWPAISMLAGRTQQLMLLTDYDRPENVLDVDTEGPLFDLARKRVETFGSRGKTVAESSPGFEFTGDWQPRGHEAPPAAGILSLYNAGTRARWYWPCLHCGERFEAAPGVEVFGLPKFDELLELVERSDLHSLADEYARVACTGCGALHEQSDRAQLNARGRWLHEGERFDGENVVGSRRRVPVASYWLGGVGAVFQSWHAMLERYFAALVTYARLGDESPLRATVTMDQGMAYRPRASLRRHSGETLRKRAEDWRRGTVPDGVRFLISAVDAQSSRFVVQVLGFGVGLEQWLVDRYDIGDVDPAAVVEDWRALLEVARREYPLASGSGTLAPLLTMVDSGGAEGVTQRAYQFWRTAAAAGLRKRVRLVKGTGSPNAPRVRVSWPDSTTRSDRGAGSRGDVPLVLVNANLLKDGLANDLARETPGPGYVHFGDWLEASVFDEITAEERTPKGWRGRSGVRNEALDLAVYARAGAILLRAERSPTGRGRRAGRRSLRSV